MATLQKISATVICLQDPSRQERQAYIVANFSGASKVALGVMAAVSETARLRHATKGLSPMQQSRVLNDLIFEETEQRSSVRLSLIAQVSHRDVDGVKQRVSTLALENEAFSREAAASLGADRNDLQLQRRTFVEAEEVDRQAELNDDIIRRAGSLRAEQEKRTPGQRTTFLDAGTLDIQAEENEAISRAGSALLKRRLASEAHALRVAEIDDADIRNGAIIASSSAISTITGPAVDLQRQRLASEMGVIQNARDEERARVRDIVEASDAAIQRRRETKKEAARWALGP